MKDLKIHAIPTEDRAEIVFDTVGNRFEPSPDFPYGETVNVKPYHIYLTSDDEIKEGDWCRSNYNELLQISYKGSKVKENVNTFCRKIVATSDPNLRLESPAITAAPELAKKNGWEHYPFHSISKEDHPLIVDALNNDKSIWCETYDGGLYETHHKGEIKLNEDGSIKLVREIAELDLTLSPGVQETVDRQPSLDKMRQEALMVPKDRFGKEKLYTREEVRRLIFNSVEQFAPETINGDLQKWIKDNLK